MTYQGKYMKPSGRPPMRLGSLMIRIALILLCLVMISIHLMGGMYAKYTTKGNGSDDARVAKFDVKLTGVETDLNIVCDENPEKGTYTIKVENKSEVAVSYEISVSVTPLDSNGDGTADFDASAVSAVLNSDSGTLAVGAEVATHELTFTVDDWSKITATMEGKSDEVSFKFTVTIDVVQVD